MSTWIAAVVFHDFFKLCVVFGRWNNLERSRSLETICHVNVFPAKQVFKLSFLWVQVAGVSDHDFKS